LPSCPWPLYPCRHDDWPDKKDDDKDKKRCQIADIGILGELAIQRKLDICGELWLTGGVICRGNRRQNWRRA
jgi:hypothetical protein